MQNRFGLLVTDMMPIYMIMPRYSHNYAQFYQLLNSNLFTLHRILMLLRVATSETYGPRVYSHHINLHHFNLALLFFLLCIFIPKIPKILYLSDLTLVRTVKGLTTPNRVGCEEISFCVGTRDLSVASYWIDTLVLKN